MLVICRKLSRFYVILERKDLQKYAHIISIYNFNDIHTALLFNNIFSQTFGIKQHYTICTSQLGAAGKEAIRTQYSQFQHPALNVNGKEIQLRPNTVRKYNKSREIICFYAVDHKAFLTNVQWPYF